VIDTRTKLMRAESLAAQSLIAEADLDAAGIAYDQAMADLQSETLRMADAQAMLEEARAAVDQAKLNFDHTIISSPIDGVVVARHVEAGQTVVAATQGPVLFNIAADLKRLQADVDVNQADVAGIEPGEPVTLQVESYPDETFRGTVSNIRLQPVAEQTATAVAYATTIEVWNPRDRLRPGMTAIVTLDGARRDNAIRLPNGALSFRPTGDMLEAVGQTLPVIGIDRANVDASRGEAWKFDGIQFVPLTVVPGLRDNQWTEVVQGAVRPGETVVTAARLGTKD